MILSVLTCAVVAAALCSGRVGDEHYPVDRRVVAFCGRRVASASGGTGQKFTSTVGAGLGKDRLQVILDGVDRDEHLVGER